MNRLAITHQTTNKTGNCVTLVGGTVYKLTKNSLNKERLPLSKVAKFAPKNVDSVTGEISDQVISKHDRLKFESVEQAIEAIAQVVGNDGVICMLRVQDTNNRLKSLIINEMTVKCDPIFPVGTPTTYQGAITAFTASATNKGQVHPLLPNQKSDFEITASSDQEAIWLLHKTWMPQDHRGMMCSNIGKCRK